MRRRVVVIAVALGVAAGISGATAAGAFGMASAAKPSLAAVRAATRTATASAPTAGTAPSTTTPSSAPTPRSNGQPVSGAPRASGAPRSAPAPAPARAPQASKPPSLASGAGSPAPTSTSDDPVLVAGAYVGREPTQIDFSSDAGNVVTHLTWTSWTATGAVGVGTSDDDTCLPNCASAPVVPEHTTVTLSAPSGDHFTAITEARGSQTQQFAYPATWPDAATSTTLPTSTPSQASGGGVGSAALTFTGVISGQLQDSVATCTSRPSTESSISVRGTLNGSSWVLSLDSYDAGSGVWQVVTGPAGGATGTIGQGYGVTATYPAVVSGVTAVDWAQGAAFDVQLASRTGQTPAGNVTVEGSISCGVVELQ